MWVASQSLLHQVNVSNGNPPFCLAFNEKNMMFREPREIPTIPALKAVIPDHKLAAMLSESHMNPFSRQPSSTA
jgi:hypothetical protein